MLVSTIYTHVFCFCVYGCTVKVGWSFGSSKAVLHVELRVLGSPPKEVQAKREIG